MAVFSLWLDLAIEVNCHFLENEYDDLSFLCGISQTLSAPAIFIYLFVYESKAFVTWFLLGV